MEKESACGRQEDLTKLTQTEGYMYAHIWPKLRHESQVMTNNVSEGKLAIKRVTHLPLRPCSYYLVVIVRELL